LPLTCLLRTTDNGAHVAPGPVCRLDERARIGLQVQPPGRLGRTHPFMAIETRFGPSS
jgi:hypothetical protein